MPEPSPCGPDLLADPLFTVTGEDGSTAALCLPDLLAHLLAGPEVAGFPHVTAEQRGHWWRFLVRCAAKSLHERGVGVEAASERSPGELADDIARALTALAPEGAWALYQPDPACPGFLQIPTPDGEPPGKGNNYKPNSLALLTSTIGSKGHERKTDVARELTPEQAAYALVEYQLGTVFGGRGNYESQLLGSRSGAGSGTPFMGVRVGDSLRETFRHDVGAVLDEWESTVGRTGLQGQVWALWAEPWDGKSQLGSERLDPAFIPLARLVRLGPPDDRNRFGTVWFRPTDVGRVRDHTDGGVLGDPFTPLVPDPKTGAPKVRGTLRKGYDYTEVVRLLFGSDEQGGTASPTVQALQNRGELERDDLHVVFEGTAYEQGKTGGFHRRVVLLPTGGGYDVFNWLQEPKPVRIAHTAMLDRVKKTKSALRGAARILLSGSPKPREGDATKVEAATGLLEQRVDAAYLEHLFETAAGVEQGNGDDWIDPWAVWLTEQAIGVFRASLGMLPGNTNQRWEREIGAESFLRFKLAQMREIGGEEGTESEGEAEPEQQKLEEEEVE